MEYYNTWSGTCQMLIGGYTYIVPHTHGVHFTRVCLEGVLSRLDHLQLAPEAHHVVVHVGEFWYVPHEILVIRIPEVVIQTWVLTLRLHLVPGRASRVPQLCERIPMASVRLKVQAARARAHLVLGECTLAHEAQDELAAA
jgi:hypothetical protein